jgi:hypothetical protein
MNTILYGGSGVFEKEGGICPPRDKLCDVMEVEEDCMEREGHRRQS